MKILETFFGLDDDEDQQLVPQVDSQQQQYAFGGPASVPGGDAVEISDGSAAGAQPMMPSGGFNFS